MAKMIDFPIPKNPELAELAFAIAAYMGQQVELNQAVQKALDASAALAELQMSRIATLEAQMHSIRYKDDCV